MGKKQSIKKALKKAKILRGQSFPKWRGSKIPLTDDERSAQIDLEGAVQAEKARRDLTFRMRMAQLALEQGKNPEGYFGLSSKDKNIGVPIADHELPIHMRKDVINPETHQILLNPKTSPEVRKYIINEAIRQGTRDDMAMLRSPHTGLLPHYQAHINGTAKAFPFAIWPHQGFLKKSGQYGEFGWIAPGGEHLAKPDAWKQFLERGREIFPDSAEQAETMARHFHTSAIQKHNAEHFSRTGKTWIAPGGEHLVTPKARLWFLQKYKDPDRAKQVHWQQIQDHNDLYLRDKQPLGLPGTMHGLKTGTLTQDPAGAATKWRDATQKPPRPWTVNPGESSAEAQQRQIKRAEDNVTESLRELSEPATPLVHPENWDRHGLRNSFGKTLPISKPFPYAIWPHNGRARPE